MPAPTPQRRRGPPLAPERDRNRLEAFGQGIVPRELPVCGRDLAPSCHTELLAQDIRVSLRRPGGDPEAGSHLLVRATGGDKFHDLALPLSDRWRWVHGVVHADEPNAARVGVPSAEGSKGRRVRREALAADRRIERRRLAGPDARLVVVVAHNDGHLFQLPA